MYDIILRVTPNHFIIKFVEFSHMEKKDFPRVTLVFEDGKWVGAHKMTLAVSSCLCAAAWQNIARIANAVTITLYSKVTM